MKPRINRSYFIRRMSCPHFILSFLTLSIGSLDANSSIYQPLNPPKAEEIIAFTNTPPPDNPQPSWIRQTATREEVIRFLREGKNNLNVSSWYKLEYPTPRRMYTCEGVIVDQRGQFYFWFLRSARTLKLETPDGRTALL